MDRSGGVVRASRYRPFLRRLALAADAPRGTLTVLFCGDEEIAALNGRWRAKPHPTDVLSFPGGARATGVSGEAPLGDVAISVPTAARAARRGRRTLAREIETLLAHGLLHVLGYDHETDDGTMLRLQARILREARRGARTKDRFQSDQTNSTRRVGPPKVEASSEGRKRRRTRAQAGAAGARGHRLGGATARRPIAARRSGAALTRSPEGRGR